MLTSRISSGLAVGEAGIRRGRLASGAPMAAPDPAFVQRGLPPGVPPLALTGERTLPDVPAENYFFRRHEAAYDWIAPLVAGRRVVDLACGEGYGAHILAARATSVLGVDAEAEVVAHAQARYADARTSFAVGDVTTWEGPCDAICFLQTIEHIEDDEAFLRRCRELVGPGGLVVVSTPNVLTLAPPGAERSHNPFHVREHRPEGFAALCRAAFDDVELLGTFHARKLAVHAFALEHLRWDDVHRRLGLTRAFYDRFTPAIAARDFVVRADRDLAGALDLIAVCRA